MGRLGQFVVAEMMNGLSSLLLLFSSSLIVCNGQLASNTNQLVNQVNGLAQGMVALNARIISARSMITNKGEDNDVRAVSDYYLGSGDKCGPQTITGWSQNVDYARTKDTLETGTRFNSGTGIYTPIIAGITASVPTPGSEVVETLLKCA